MRRGIVYILLTCVCVYVGILNKERSYFYVASVMAAVMVFLVLGLVVRVLNTELGMKVNIPVVEKNAEFHPVLTVDTSFGQVPYVSAVFKVTAAGVRKGKHTYFRQIDDKRGRCETGMRLAVSGRYEIEAADVRIYDAMHVFYKRKKIKTGKYIYVLPQCYLIPINVTKKTRDFVTDSDVYYADARGDDSGEVYQIREYRPGDRLMNIHWKLTARQDEIMVRDASKSLSCPVIICVNLDGKGCRNYGQSMSTTLETMVSVSFSLIDVRVPHFIVWYDPEAVSITRYRITKEEDVYDAAATMSFVDAAKAGRYDIIGMYREKYRGEDFTTFIDIDMKGNVSCGDDKFCVRYGTLQKDLEKIYLTV